MLTRDEVLTFLNEKRIAVSCPSCAAEDWYLGAKEHDFSAQLLIPSPDTNAFVLPPKHVPLVYLICKNCGHVRTYAKGLIQQFADAQKEEVEGEAPSSAEPGASE